MAFPRVAVGSVVGILLCASVATAQPITALVHGRVIDGTGGTPLADATVVLRADRIEAVGAFSSVQIPAGARVIDVAGKTIMPGLADMHVHLTGGWDGERADMLGYQRYLNALLYAGVTTVLDTGDVLPFIQQIKQEAAAGRLASPTIKMAGPLIDGPDPIWPPLSFSVSAASQMPGIVKLLKESQVDVIKGYGGLSEPLLAALVRSAKADGLRVFVDAGGRNGTTVVAETGIAAFAHLGRQPLTEETIALQKNRSIANITTLAVFESFARLRFADVGFMTNPLIADVMPPTFQSQVRDFMTHRPTDAEAQQAATYTQRLAAAKANAKRLFDAGVLVVAGTDSPYPGVYYGEGLHRELELLVDAGLTPTQAIASATRNAARLMNEEGEWGSVAPGLRADLVVVAGDPSRTIRDSRRIDMVFQRGRLIDRKTLQFDRTLDSGFEATGRQASAP